MHVIINGEAQDVPADTTVRALLEERELAGGPCAVEVNREIVPKRRHAEHALREGDHVEIVTLVGGG